MTFLHVVKVGIYFGTKFEPRIVFILGRREYTYASCQSNAISIQGTNSTRMAASLYKVRRVHTTQTSILKQYMLVFERTQYMLVSPVEFWYFLFVE